MATIPGERKITCKVNVPYEPMELLCYLSGRFTYHSRDRWREIIADGQITLNSQTVKNIPQEIKLNDVIEYFPGDLPEPPVDLSYKVIYEDDDLLLIDKSGNLPVHPAGPFFKHTLWYKLRSVYDNVFPVNRLDRETSGVMVWAKNPLAAKRLSGQFATAQCAKTYLAIVYGEFPAGTQEATGFLRPDEQSMVRKKQRFVYEIDPAADSEVKYLNCSTTFDLFHYHLDGKYSVVKASLHSGRFHQIRATLCSMGYPLVGDKLYGPDDTIYLRLKDDLISEEDYAKLLLPRQALHSWKVSFVHPSSGARLEFTAEIPFDLQQFLI